MQGKSFAPTRRTIPKQTSSQMRKSLSSHVRTRIFDNNEIYIKQHWIFTSRSSGVKAFGRLQ